MSNRILYQLIAARDGAKMEGFLGKPGWLSGLLLAVLVLAIWAPRGLALDRFVTVDEPKWLARSGNFYLALSNGDLEGTFTREHPGVTVTWAGLIGFLWRYPAYPGETPGRLTESGEIADVLKEHNKQPIEVLEAGRIVMVLAITVVLMAAFHAAVRLFGFLPALIGFLLIAIDPFHIGLSRLLHLDGLMSSLVVLSLLTFLTYLHRGRRLRDLVLSGMAAGLSWLTKSPAFILVPVVGLLSLVEFGREVMKARRTRWIDVWPVVWPLMLWGGIGSLIFVLFWPAMWVNPVSVLQRVFAEAEVYATEGHSSEIYFAGKVITGDPGWRFYPVTYLWRSTPVVLLGLGLWLVGSLSRYQSSKMKQATWPAAALVLFALLFAIFMTFGSKKFDRYLLPIYMPLDLVAGIGWVMAAGWLGERIYPQKAGLIFLILLVTIVSGQAIGALQTYPYYLSYYNPLMGGSAQAPRVMMIGWGEGIDQAARYLNGKPDAEQMRVTSWYPDGSFSYFFKGETLGVAPEWEQTEPIVFGSDYVVTYIHQWQRGLPFPEMLAYFSKQTPEKVISLNGLEYAQIYNMRTLPGPEGK
jgi:hypothetical protein